MNLFRLSLFSLFSLLQNLLTAQEPIRTWTSSDGRTLEARFIEQVGSNVRIKNEAGREFTLPITRFSPADQEYVVEAAARAFFQTPEPFEDRGKGAIIIASATGKVMVIPAPRYSGSQEVKPVPRDVIIGEPLPDGSTIMTGANSEADLLLTTGSLAKVGPNSKLVLSAFWQKDFRASAKKVTDLKEETSPSRVAFKLEIGDLVVDVKKLNRESSFVVESPLGDAGIRGTQFGFSSDPKSTGLSVLEGKVTFQDSKKRTTSVETSKKIEGTREGAGKLIVLPETEKADLAKSVVESQKVESKYDLTRLANTVEGYSAKSNYIVKSALDMELIWCPPGSFKQGYAERTQRQVVLTKGFFLGKYEVTQEEYEIVMGTNPSRFKTKKLPVENVSWNDAVDFCKVLNRKERIPIGWKFSLPTEAQWEYACRAGTTTRYHWGDDINPNRANYKESGLEKTRLRGAYPKNPWGFHDMHGNVWEWTADWYQAAYPTVNPVVDPTGPASGSDRVLLGGSWFHVGSYLRAAGRLYGGPSTRFSIGFRVGFQKSQ